MPSVTNPPKQSRAVKTRAKLMTALEDLLKHQEFELISVQDIAQQAGVAVGSVYSHFKDKNAFLETLLETWQTRVKEQLEVAEANDAKAAFEAMGDLELALFEITKAVHAQILESGHILRAVHTYTRLNPDAGDEAWQALVVRSFAPIRDLLDVYADEITAADPDLAVRMLGVFFNTIFIRAALMPQDTLLEAVELDDATLIREAAHMVHGYLTRPFS